MTQNFDASLALKQIQSQALGHQHQEPPKPREPQSQRPRLSSRGEIDSVFGDSCYSDYKKETILGKGAYATTFRGLHIPSGTPVAIKIYNHKSNSKLRDCILMEIQVLRAIEHPHVVKLYQAFEEKGKFVLILE